MVVVNMFGVPGAGKSTGTAYVFSRLKMSGYNCELISEFAKDKVWEENKTVFENQAYIFGKQSYRQSRCDGKVDILLTDSPLPLSIIYNHDQRLTENFNLTVMDVFNSYENLNFLLDRVKPYNPIGRLQTESESDALKGDVENLLNERNIPYIRVPGDLDGYDYIVKIIKEYMENRKNEES